MLQWQNQSAMLAKLTVLETLREEEGAETYRVRRENDPTVWILKHRSVPRTQRQLEGLRLSGAYSSEEELRRYYAQQTEKYRQELALFSELSELVLITPFEDHEIIEKSDGIGFDLFLLRREQQTLSGHLDQVPATHASAVKLACDLAASLAALREKGYLYGNLKPDNLFYGEDGRYRIGDLGLFSLENLKFSALSEEMIGDYSAPEFFDATEPLNETADTYALGLILYELFNGRHAPFEDEQVSKAAARKKRLDGEELPTPIYADYEMAAIILRACAFRKEDRYPTPQVFCSALQNYVNRNALRSELLIPPLNDENVQVSPEAMQEELTPLQVTETNENRVFVEHFTPREEQAPTPEEVFPEEEELPEEPPSAEPKKKSAAWLWWLIGAVAAAAVAFGAWRYFAWMPTVTALTYDKATSDTVFVSVTADCPLSRLRGECRDSYGGVYTAEQVGQSFVFRDLRPGISYRVSVKTERGGAVRGMSELTVQTPAALTVTAFDAEVREDFSVRLTFTLSEPEAGWKLYYSAAQGEEKALAVTDGEVLLTELLPETDYRAVLACEGRTVQGKSELSFRTPRVPEPAEEEDEITVRELRYSGEDGTLRWEISGEFVPSDWKAVCTVTDLAPDAILPEQDASVTCTPADGEQPSIVLNGLLPECVYRAELFHGTDCMGEIRFTTEAGDTFAELGCTAVYTGVFLAPEKPSPRYSDFSQTRSTFSSEETVGLVLQSATAPESSDKEMTLCAVVRTQSGAVTDFCARTEPWDALWEDGRLVVVLPRTPKTPGAYNVTVLLDGKTVTTAEFTVK